MWRRGGACAPGRVADGQKHGGSHWQRSSQREGKEIIRDSCLLTSPAQKLLRLRPVAMRLALRHLWRILKKVILMKSFFMSDRRHGELTPTFLQAGCAQSPRKTRVRGLQTLESPKGMIEALRICTRVYWGRGPLE